LGYYKRCEKYGTVYSILKNRLEEEDIHDRPWWSQRGILFFLTSPRKSMYKILRDIKEGVLFHHHEPIFLEVERICIFCTYKPTEKEYKNMEVRGMICKEIIC